MIIRHLSRQPYITTWHAMQAFTRNRTDSTADEIWLLEHEPVFTQGQNGKPEHILHRSATPLIQTDRGGQITWHGPGQLMAYTLIDLRRHRLNVRSLVSALENSIIQLLADFNLTAAPDPKAPGVYIDHQKICSIGLRIHRGCSYHGLAFNIDPDLSDFQNINPCGFEALKMTRLSDWIQIFDRQMIEKRLADLLTSQLSYNDHLEVTGENQSCHPMRPANNVVLKSSPESLSK